MNPTTGELLQAREVACSLLRELSLAAYLYDLEPHGEHYELKVECACSSDGEWTSTSLVIPRTVMLRGADDPIVKHRIKDQLRKKLALCKR